MYRIKQRAGKNTFLPWKSRITAVHHMGNGVKLLRVTSEEKTDYRPGQFFMVGTWGAGEVPISVTSAKESDGMIEFAIKRVGGVTTAIHRLRKGDTLWIRGPYGNGFDIAPSRKKDVLFIAGGIGIVPLRPLIHTILKRRKPERGLFLLYGAKNPSELFFEHDRSIWMKKGVNVILTVDKKNRTWGGKVGTVTDHIDTMSVDFKRACAYVCGPDIMIQRTMEVLSARGMHDESIVTSLEARMKCGVGKCGQCYHGTEYICTNGPVYTCGEIKKRKVCGP